MSVRDTGRLLPQCQRRKRSSVSRDFPAAAYPAEPAKRASRLREQGLSAIRSSELGLPIAIMGFCPHDPRLEMWRCDGPARGRGHSSRLALYTAVYSRRITLGARLTL
ncbi:hypothetical protein RRG08_060829 [Elysia crispata]|uniref:Uncharacterized protein n=1 Tax=Elysia crispata TaxID=231223 RepID=A0AAE1DFE0_9GAST|nr:hypothetical protein RRG08_060829 [Elysia crispata]